MIFLEELIPKIKQARENQDTYRLSMLAEDALKTTEDEKSIKSGSQWLANRLSEVINEFESTDVRIDDLRYRLAHLYMRSKKWKEADDQLLELEDSDYYKTEAQIYSALCSIKLGYPLNIDKIAEQWKQVNTVKSKSIQEQHYDLLEMLVYAADIEYSVLDFYYKRGSTRADLEICYFDQQLSKQKSGWLPIARFRLIHLLQSCKKQGFLIIDLRDSKFKDLENFTTYIKTPAVKRLAEILARKFPQTINFTNLKKELEEFRKPELRTSLKKAKEEKEAKEKANIFEQCDSVNSKAKKGKKQDSASVRISEWKGKLCKILKEQSGIENSISVHENIEHEKTTYRLEHSFILIRERSTS